MKKMFKTLVIIVTYNGQKWIRQCLSSIDTSKYDVLVIDNLSTDNTVEIISNEYPEVELIRNNENSGFGKANNIGLAIMLKKDYDYALLLNQDAWLEPDTIERLVEKQQKNSDYWIVSPLQRNSIENGVEYLFGRYLKKNKINFKSTSIQKVKFVNAAIWLISRECVETVGGFAPIFPHYGEDDNYAYRVHYFGKKIGVDISTIAYHDNLRKIKDAHNKRKIDIYRLVIVFLVTLTNIKHSLFRRYMKVLQIMIIKCLVYLIHGNLSAIKTYFVAHHRVIKKMNEVKECRKATRAKKAYLV